MSGPGKRMMIYVGESDSWRGRSLYISILEALRKSGVAGATVMRGAAGFGAHSLIHTAAIERLSVDLPVIIMVVDTPDNVERALAVVKPMVREGLITLEDIEIVKYVHRYLQPLPADQPVSTIMTQNVTTVTPDTPMLQVIELLLGKLFKAVPVVDDKQQVVGIVTEDDLLQKGGLPAHLDVVGRLEDDELREVLSQITRQKTVREIMTFPVQTAREDEALGHVVQRLLDLGLKRFPVVDRQGRLVGMVSRLDILRAAGGYGVGQQEQAPLPGPGRTLGELMTARVPTVHAYDDLVDVLKTMLESAIKYVIVLDEQGKPLGVITEGDLVARVAPVMRRTVLQTIAARVLGKELRRGDVTARELMSQHVLSALPETTVPEAIALMLREGRKRILVVDEQGYPVGIVDRQTLMAASLGA